MKLTKRLAALALCLCLLCGIPLSVSAADNTITMEKAVVTEISDAGVTVQVTFSAPVRLIQRQYSKFYLSAPTASSSCNGDAWQMWKHSNVVYLNPQLNAAEEEYSTDLVMTFEYCADANHKAMWINGETTSVPENVWIGLDDTAQNVAPADATGYLSTALIKGINDEPIVRQSVSETSTKVTSKTYVEVTEFKPDPDPVELLDVSIDETCVDDAKGTGAKTYTAILTFSDYVHVTEGKGWYFALCTNQDANSAFTLRGNSQTVFTYEDTMEKDEVTYGKIVKIPYYLFNNNSATGLASFIQNNKDLGIRIHDDSYRSGDIDFITDQYDRTLACSTLSSGYDYVWMPCNNDGNAVVKNITLNGAALNAEGMDLTIPAGMTLDLNGKNINADSVTVFGALKDSTEGKGVVKVGIDGLLFGAPTTAVLPLYNSGVGGYHLFTASVNHRNYRYDAEAKTVKFGVCLALGGEEFNETAYTLLMDSASANGNMTFDFELQIDGGSTIKYTVSTDIIKQYAEQLLAEPEKLNSKAIVLTVYGVEAMEPNMTLSCTPRITSGSYSSSEAENIDTNATQAFAVGGTQTYTHTA